MSRTAVHTLIVFLGAGIGANARYWSGSLFVTMFPRVSPHWATVGINVVGSLLIGVAYALESHGSMGESWKLLAIVGFLGGFTTFSSFSWETIRLWQQGAPGMALLNVAVSNLIAILACWGGYALTRAVA